MAIQDSKFEVRCAPVDFIGEAIGEVIAARRESDDLFGRVIVRLELVERENVELRKRLAQEQPEYFTGAQVANILQVSEDTIARLRARRKIPFTRLGARVYRWSKPQVADIARVLEVKPKFELIKKRNVA